MNERRRLGVCTWTFGDLALDEIAQRLSTLGFDGVELMGDLARYQVGEAARVLQDYGLAVFSLTPENVDLAHPDRAVRAGAIAYYLRLLDFAAELRNPIVACHGYVGRVRAVSTLAEERAVFVSSVAQIAERARELGLRLVMEVLNRYEAHLLNTATEALDFVTEVGAENVGILLDAYHMNIEEANPAGALHQAGERLWLYHAADSNRQGIGRGHAQRRTLEHRDDRGELPDGQDGPRRGTAEHGRRPSRRRWSRGVRHALNDAARAGGPAGSSTAGGGGSRARPPWTRDGSGSPAR